MNLELEREFGAKVWQENLAQAERAIETFKMGNLQLDDRVEEINKKRKFSQLSQADAYMALQGRIQETRQKNQVLECEIARIELACLQASGQAVAAQKR